MPTKQAAPLPKLSIKERDRRYQRVRKAMAREKIDVLVLPANHSRWEQMMADSRYLTTIGGYGTETLTVFPREGEVTAFVFNRSGFWKGVQDWVRDVRDGRNRWSENVAERLRELGLREGCIGISGMGGLIRAPDGIVPYGMVEGIREAFPKAKIVNATTLVQEARSVKSAEEVALLRHSAEIAERMAERMIAEARPGANEKQIYADMIHTLLSNGGELSNMMIFAGGKALNHGQFVPTDKLLRKGDMLVNEIQATYAGYGAQIVQPVAIGTPPRGYEALLEASRTCFDNVTAAMRPGVTLGELMDTYTKTVKRTGKGKYRSLHPMMHARGLGDEAPALLGDDDLARFRGLPLKAGQTFIVKPRVGEVDGKLTAQIGDTVVVTRNGGKRLGKRELALARTAA